MKITLVLATNRTGSTLLCRDIESLGGMGNPREHFLPLLHHTPDSPPTLAHVVDALNNGRDRNIPDVFGVKIMVDHAPAIYSWISGRDETDPLSSLEGIVEWCRSRFDALNMLAVKRESILDQAISLATAHLTGVYLANADTLNGRDPYAGHDLDEDQLNQQILKELAYIASYTPVLQTFVAHNKDDVLLLTYEDIAKSRLKTSSRIRRHAVANGFRPLKRRPVRKLVKLIDEKRSKEIKQAFWQFINAPNARRQ